MDASKASTLQYLFLAVLGFSIDSLNAIISDLIQYVTLDAIYAHACI